MLEFDVLVSALNRYGELFWGFSAVMFVQVTILFVIILILDVTVLKKLRASVRYAFWMLVLLKLVLPVGLVSPIGIVQLLPSQPEPAFPVFEISNAVQADDPRAGQDARQFSLPVDIPLSVELQADVAAKDSKVGAVLTSASSPASTNDHDVKTRIHLSWQAGVLLCWLVSVLVLVMIFILRILRVRRVIARSDPSPDAINSLLDECLHRTQCRRHQVSIRLTNEFDSPAICGFFHATILLPISVVKKFDTEQLRLIVLHELAHWRRYDLQVSCFQAILQILYFYHPVVWAANFFVRRSREQAVDEAVLVMNGSNAQQYSKTLLDVAVESNQPLPSGLQMIGVVASKKALHGRIQRIMSRPIPTKSRLGYFTTILVLIAGAILLPMAKTDHQAARAAVPQVSDPAEDTGRTFEGKLIDETGKPVTDAELRMSAVNGQGRYKVKTDTDGKFKFEKIAEPGQYRFVIESQQWVGITPQDRERIIISDQTPNKRDFTLQRACRIRVRTVDEQGEPISGVPLMAANLSENGSRAPETVRTDKDGWVTIGGLKSSETEYIVATMHDDYGFEKFTTRLKDPTKIPTHELTLRAGKDVKGTAVCSDGKPPAGWRILALPKWWHFGRSPIGGTIGKDGSFTLPHIVPGEYNVRISIPSGENGSRPRNVLAEADLWGTQDPIKVKLDYPSPASLVYISGRVKQTGKPVTGGFRISARSADNQISSSTYYRGKGEFRIGPIPPGKYTLVAEGVGLEAKRMTVKAPADDVELKVSVKGQPRLTGIVIDQQTQKPVEKYQVRVLKLRTLRGPNYSQAPDWHEFTNSEGAFSIDVTGPGIYRVLISAKNRAWTMSEMYNTDKDTGTPIQVALSSGVPIKGTVVNEEGVPIDGAIVTPLSRLASSFGMPAKFNEEADAAKVVNGQFKLNHMQPGLESLKIVHSDYTPTTVPPFEILENHPSIEIIMKRGATVRGRVFDDRGQPEAGVTLFFDERNRYGYPGDEQGRFATVVTDEKGFYEVHHLPEQLCYVHRSERSTTFGVVRKCLLPQNGRVHTLNMGGKTQLRGRLIVNGVPCADGRLVLSKDGPHFGIFKAYAQTHSDGSFTFCGPQPGDWTLYYAIPGRKTDWGRVRDIRVTKDSQDLNDLNHVTARVQVKVETDANSSKVDGRLRLQDFDPRWSRRSDVGLVTRPDSTGTFVIDHVPVGHYELVYSTPDQRFIRQQIDITDDKLAPEFQLQIPTGTATLSGRVDKRLRDGKSYRRLTLWNEAGTLSIKFIPKQADGTYELNNLPSGKYSVRKGATRNEQPWLEFALTDGENRVLDFTPENVSNSNEKLGFLVVYVFQNDGVLTTCQTHLENEQGRIEPSSSQNGRTTFVAPPGLYSLVVTPAGSPEIRHNVQLKPLNDETRKTRSYQKMIHLE